MKPQTIFDSVEAMLAPGAVGALVGARVERVTIAPFRVEHRSANELHEVWLDGEGGRTRLILKEFQPQRDWVMRLTHDAATREARLFVEGVYARLPRELVVPVIAAARRGDSWATLMRDVSGDLLATDAVMRAEDARALLEALAALHAGFWDDAALADPAPGLSSLEDFVTILSPGRVQGELDAGRAHPVMEMAARGWKEFFASTPEDVRGIVREMQENPAPLLRALKGMPQTLVHGDYKVENLGIARGDGRGREREREGGGGMERGGDGKREGWREGQRTVVLDWQDAARGAGSLDLGYFLALNARWLPFDKERAIELYREALAARGCEVTMRDVEIGMMAGGPLRLFWLMVMQGQRDVDWWYEVTRRVGRGERKMRLPKWR